MTEKPFKAINWKGEEVGAFDTAGEASQFLRERYKAGEDLNAGAVVNRVPEDPIAALAADEWPGRLRDWRDRQGYLDGLAADGCEVRWESWQRQNAAAVALLKEAADALLDLAVMDLSVWFDNSERFTCSEADVVAGLIRLLHGEDVANEFLSSHGEGDLDEDDAHYVPSPPARWRPQLYAGNSKLLWAVTNGREYNRQYGGSCQVIRYGSAEVAQRVADRLNEAERTEQRNGC